jgi:hypothetical protein
MKILDQYIYAIGKKLPFKTRKEIKTELRSLMLDEIEANYGEHPNQDQIEEAIRQYGSPREVANRYKSNNLVIGNQFTDLFFFIAKIIVFALTVAFTVIFIIELFTSNLTINEFLSGIGQIIFNVFNASFAAFGWLSVIFILLTRFSKGDDFDMDEDWSPKELKDIQIGPEEESKIESGITIFFTLLMITVINAAPQLIKISERSFELSGMQLGHYVQLGVFKSYLIPLTIIWTAGIVYHAFNLFTGRSKLLAIYDVILEITGALIMLSMAFNMSLYTEYQTILGYRAIFMLVAVIGSIESIGKLIKFFKYYVLEK